MKKDIIEICQNEDITISYPGFLEFKIVSLKPHIIKINVKVIDDDIIKEYLFIIDNKNYQYDNFVKLLNELEFYEEFKEHINKIKSSPIKF